MTKSKKPTAFDQLRERIILKHVRSVIWIMIATEPALKFMSFYRYGMPDKSIIQEVRFFIKEYR